MKSYIKILFIILLSGVLMKTGSYAMDGPKPEIGIDEKLGSAIPLDLSFLDEYGKPVRLRELITKPTILSLVYFRCPGICTPLLNGLALTVDHLDLEPGKDYNIITISFDPRETYTTAAEKKKNYLEDMKKKIPESSWRFLTGDSLSIARITDAVGFRYQPQGNDYMHSAAIMVLSSDGKIARYLYGVEFLPLDLKLALVEASEGRVGPTINKLLKLCYSYDPGGRKYVLNVTRIAGGGMVVLIVTFVLILRIKKKKHSSNTPETEQGGNKNG
jgi:protein SCO1/2